MNDLHLKTNLFNRFKFPLELKLGRIGHLRI
jgi:hypothetical protein